MSDLVTWLRAQLDWAETDAAEDHTLGCKVYDWAEPEVYLTDPNECDCRVRGRLLDVAAKRAILDAYDEAVQFYDTHRSAPAGELHGLWTAIQHLATAYVDREGYDESWRL